MHMPILFCLLALLTTSIASETRTWTSRMGSTIEARLISIQADKLELEMENGRQLKIKTSDLSEADQAQLPEILVEFYGQEIPGIDAQPGKISPAISCQNAEWTYHAYLPTSFHLGKKWPVWFIMSAGGGKGGQALNRYIRGAESLQAILIIPVESKNGFYTSPQVCNETAEDVYDRFPVAKRFAFSSGMSGGSRNAYLLSERNRNISGVLACGSGDGVYHEDQSFKRCKLRSDVYVYSLMGATCFNRTGAYECHARFPDHFRLRYFPGKHVWAGAELIEEGMARVMAAALLEHESLSVYQDNYLLALSKLAQSKEESAPWEAAYLYKFGLEFDHPTYNSSFNKALSQLSKDPKVQLAQEAEEDMLQLAKEFYLKHNYFNGDGDPLPARLKLAEKLATPYEDIPHGETLIEMGKPAPSSKSKK